MCSYFLPSPVGGALKHLSLNELSRLLLIVCAEGLVFTAHVQAGLSFSSAESRSQAVFDSWLRLRRLKSLQNG